MFGLIGTQVKNHYQENSGRSLLSPTPCTSDRVCRLSPIFCYEQGEFFAPQYPLLLSVIWLKESLISVSQVAISSSFQHCFLAEKQTYRLDLLPISLHPFFPHSSQLRLLFCSGETLETKTSKYVSSRTRQKFHPFPQPLAWLLLICLVSQQFHKSELQRKQSYVIAQQASKLRLSQISKFHLRQKKVRQMHA